MLTDVAMLLYTSCIYMISTYGATLIELFILHTKQCVVIDTFFPGTEEKGFDALSCTLIVPGGAEMLVFSACLRCFKAS